MKIKLFLVEDINNHKIFLEKYKDKSNFINIWKIKWYI